VNDSPQRPISELVSLTDILARYGLLARLRNRGARLIGTCPIHGGTRNGQFVVSVPANAWFCFGDCNRGGGTIALVAAIERVSDASAAALIAEWFALIPKSPPSHRSTPMGARPSHKVLAVTDRTDAAGTKSFFTRIGAAWPIKGGAGLSIQLDALPVNGRLVVMEFDADELPDDASLSATKPKA
jgi:hypothetical protein